MLQCGGKHATSTTTNATTSSTAGTTTTHPAKATNAIALARSLGCVHPTTVISVEVIPPKPTADVHCTLPDHSEIGISTYTPSGMVVIMSPRYQATLCRVARDIGPKTLYYVYGGDFVADVRINVVVKVTPNPKYHAQSQALATALGIKLTTVPCS